MVLQTQNGASQSFGAVESAGSGVVIPDAKLLFTADFSRAGHDLVLTGSDGAKFLVTGYFNSDSPPSLISPFGAKLTGDVVTSLAGPQFPGQYAQAGDSASGKTAIGKVESSSGSASVMRTDGTTEVLKPGDPVFQGDVVQTGPGSKLGISFVDGTVFSLSDNARMVLNSLVFDPDGGKSNSMLFSLVEGSFVFATGQIAPTGDMKIQTPVATMGIRGTTPTVEIVSGATTGGVNFSIIADPGTGEVGTYTLFNLETGLPIGTVSTVGTKWQLTSANGTPIEFEKNEIDLLNDANAVGQINTIYSQWQSSTQQDTQGPQAGPENSSPPSGGLNTNPQNPDAPGNEGNTGNTGGEGEGEGQNPPQNNDQQSPAPFPPPIPDTGDDPALPPIAADDGATTDENTTVTINVIGNDQDPDGSTAGLTVVSVNTSGLLGTVTINGDGSITYDPGNAFQNLNPGQSAQETFTYVMQDAQGLKDTGSVTVTVNGTTNLIDGDENPNILNGTPWDDDINGLGERDTIFASAGNDDIDGGADKDTVNYSAATQSVVINLVTGEVNSAEFGFDTIASLERFVTGSGNDTLIIGEDGPFFFDGQGGTDTIQFFGDLSVDTSNLQFDADNIEIVDLNKTHENTLTISVDDVQNDEGQPFLQIRGGTNTNGTTDTVNLTNEMSFDDYEGDLAVYDGEYPGGGYYEGSWQKSEDTFTDEDGTVFDIYEFFSYGADGPIATAHIEQGIQVNLPVAASLFEDFENGFDANGWTVINAIISDANSPDGSSSARISTSSISEGGVQSVAAISALTGIPEATLDSLADDPGGPGNVTEGGAMVTTFSGQAGQVVSFDWFFSTQDYPNFNDIAFVAIDGEIVELFDVIASGNQAGSTTTEGWNTFSLALNTSGEHTIAFGVLDDSDTAVETSLGIDNIQLGPGGGGQPLLGGPGNDILIGNQDDNILFGNGGNNTLTGNGGADKFVFGFLGDGIDLITDFGSQDTLDLTGLLNGVFDPASDNIDDFVQATTNPNGDTVISVDLDGPGELTPVDIAVLQGVGANFGISVNIGDEDTSVTSAAITV